MDETLARVWAISDFHNFSSKSLYACLDFAERYLSQKGFQDYVEFQKFWFACLYVAAKIEEIIFPCYRIYLDKLPLNLAELLHFEQDIITVLEWRMTPLYSLQFFDLYSSGMNIPQHVYSFGQQILELLAATQARTKMTHSLQAASVLSMCLQLLQAQGEKKSHLETLQSVSGYSETQLMTSSQEIADRVSFWQSRVHSDKGCALERLLHEKFRRVEYSSIGSAFLVARSDARETGCGRHGEARRADLDAEVDLR